MRPNPPVLDKLLQRALLALDASYDPTERMLRVPFHSPGYHTTLTGGIVHPTRDAAAYAAALLDSGEDARCARAEEVLDRLLDLQDRDPASRTYGIWSWFLEEPLDQMSPPDWNWADFCGAQLVAVLGDHAQRIDPQLCTRVSAAVAHAARAIVRRDVGPGYTNIAIMGAFVTLRAGELLGDADLLSYGRHRLRRFARHTRVQGAFNEYNSPTYTVVALRELARIERDVRDPEMQALAREMAAVGWDTVARHFHPPSCQWAGPHSRCYSTFLRPGTLTYLQLALGGRVHWLTEDALEPSPDLHRTLLACPESLAPRFETLARPHEERDVFARHDDGQPVTTGCAYLTPSFALASASREFLWHQRRPLLAYTGTAADPGSLRLRVLHDHYDFSSAHIVCAQSEGAVLAGIGFATDGGDTHPSLDRVHDGEIELCDLRLRIELTGSAARTPLPDPARLPAPVVLDLGTARAHVHFVLPEGAAPGRLAVGRENGLAWIDYIWIAARRHRLALAELPAPVVGVTLAFDPPKSLPPATITPQGDVVCLHWHPGETALQVTLPAQPVARAVWAERAAASPA
jgi:hypothetical protein